ncbi:MAG: penicillin-binding protein 2 [Elusimicrobia bacterium]|nr:penicillin-binding protein 2 [Elusimicrobiota bacterium]
MFYLQTIKHNNLSKIAEKEFTRFISEMGPRGTIFDINGNILAESIITWDCSIAKKDIKNKEEVLSQLAKILKIPLETLERKYSKRKNYIGIKKKLDNQQYEELKNLNLKGIFFDAVQDRFFPNADLAKNIIGIVGDNKGITGIEYLYDKVLSGNISKRGIIKDASGKTIYKNKLNKESKPLDIHLTIDKNIQFFSQEVLKKYVNKTKANLGMIIVQNPHNGNILSMVSFPQNISQIEPVQWTYEPGSTFKTITLAAALEKNIATPTDKFYCEKGAWNFSPKITLHDHEPAGTLTISEIIEKSSNIGTAKLGMNLGIKNFYFFARAFGFGAKTGLGINGESPGIMRPMEKYKPIDLAVGSYGHGINVTPIQLITAYSAIANNGILMQPKIIKKISNPREKDTFQSTPVKVRNVINPKTVRTVTEILKNVVEKGTGLSARIENYSIAGKTGTSNKLDASGKYQTSVNVTSFCGFFPADKPLYTVLVILDHPKKYVYASETVAPAFKDLAKKIIVLKGIKPDIQNSN